MRMFCIIIKIFITVMKRQKEKYNMIISFKCINKLPWHIHSKQFLLFSKSVIIISSRKYNLWLRISDSKITLITFHCKKSNKILCNSNIIEIILNVEIRLLTIWLYHMYKYSSVIIIFNSSWPQPLNLS